MSDSQKSSEEPAEEEGEEGHEESEEIEDRFLEEMFACHGGDMLADDDPEDTYQRVYWTDGIVIVREKRGERWVYFTENE